MMLDEKDLQAIAGLMKEEIGASESRMMTWTTAQIKEEIGASESRMMAMMEAYFEPKFDLLAEQMRLIQEKLLPSEAVEDLEDRMDVAEAAIKQHSREIAQLKRAQ